MGREYAPYVQANLSPLLFRPQGRGAKYYDECVCMSDLMSARIAREPHGQTSPNCLRMLPVAVARSSSDGVAICTSGFVDDVIFSNSGLMARRAYSSATIEHDRPNSRDSKQILLSD